MDEARRLKREKANDLTEGPIIKKLLIYYIPIAAGYIFQQLYNAVDAIIVGRFVGTEALAAVGGSPATITQLILGFFIALSSGATVVIAQLCGAKEKKKVESAVSTSMVFCIAIGIALSIVMFFCTPLIMNILKTPSDTFAGAVEYTRIYFAGSIFMLLFNMGSGILRAVGDSRKPLIYLIISCVCNIVLDLLFVIVFKMGVAGVAYATVIAQAVSCIFIAIDLIKTDDYYKLTFKNFRFNFILLKKMMGIGVPTGLQSALYGVSNIILQVFINGLGTVVVASWAMSGKIDGIYWALADAFGVAIMNFVAQNYGAGRLDRVEQCSKKGIGLFLVITAVVSGLLIGFAKPLLHIFTQDQAVVDTTYVIMLCFVPTYVLWTFIDGLSGTLRGVGDAKGPTVIIALGVCAVRLLYIFTVFTFIPTLIVVCLCYPISWFVTDIALFIYYRKKKKNFGTFTSA